ncbi:LamG domain-containing protein, partial [Candidatus Peribacteria bacterium]|nr:LamG domain-containing protein [Candidatus Peribacteria bacterium]
LSGAEGPEALSLGSNTLSGNLSINNGLVGYWKLDDGPGSTTARDSSSNENHGTLTSYTGVQAQTGWVAPTHTGSFFNPYALEFDGVNNYIELNDLDIPSHFTLSAWINPATLSLSESSIIFDKGKGGVGYPAYQLSLQTNNKLLCGFSNENSGGGWGTPTYSTYAISGIDTWRLVTCTYDGTNVRLYIDGALDNSSSKTGVPYDNNIATSIGAGRSSGPIAYYFNGLLDDIRIYNRGLAASEVASLANGNPTTGSGIYALGSVLNVSGDLRIDTGELRSGNGYGITLSGAWVNNSQFTSTGTVTLDGTSQNISGSTVFNNLTATRTSADTLTFDHSARQSISGALTLQGAASNMLNLRSSKTGSAAKLLLDATSGSSSLDYLDVKDSDASNGNLMRADDNSTDSGNNTNWLFGAFVWDGGGADDNWSTEANWNPNGMPTHIDNVLFDSTGKTDVVIDSAAFANNFTVTDTFTGSITISTPLSISGSLTHSGTNTTGITWTQGEENDLYIVNNLYVGSGANVTVARSSTTGYGSGQSIRVDGTITVFGDATGTGSITADGQGFTLNTGPSADTGTRDGGSHGGEGCDYSSDGNHTLTYGSITNPQSLGSAGKEGTPAGGAMTIYSSGALLVNGVISANGTSSETAFGKGAGGSINITASTVSGSGIIRANGGTITGAVIGGAGGGGRIYVKLSSGSTFMQSIQAYGGDHLNTTTCKGAAGTVYLEDATDSSGSGMLIIDNNNISAPDETHTLVSSSVTNTTIGTLLLRNGARMKVNEGSTLTTTNTGASMEIQSGTWFSNYGTMTVRGTGATVNGMFDSGTGSFITYIGNEDDDNVTLARGAHGTLTLNNDSTSFLLPSSIGNMNVLGDLNLTNGTLVTTNAQQITVSGSWLNTGGTFSGGTGTVMLISSDSSASITGNNDFNNITIDDGLVGYWKFDDTAGSTTAADSSARGNDGVLKNYDATQTQTGWVSTGLSSFSFENTGALDFDGADDYIEMPNESDFDFDRTDPFAISIWMKSDQVTTGMDAYIFSKLYTPAWGDWAGYYIGCLTKTTGVIRWILEANDWPSYNSVIDGTTKVNDNEWHHVTVMNEGIDGSASDMSIYIDGEKESVAVLSDDLGNRSIKNNTPLRLGWRGEDNWARKYNGLFDDTRIYNRTLADSEISLLANGNEIARGGGTYSLGNALDIDGNLRINDGELDVSANNYQVSISGSFIQPTGTFTSRSGDMIFSGLEGDANNSYQITASSTLNDVKLDTGLIRHWKLDDGPGSTVARDSSGQGNHGTLVNMNPSTAWIVPSHSGSTYNPYAIDFDGSNDYITASSTKGLGTGNAPHSISTWIKTGSPHGSRRWILVLGQSSTGAERWYINNSSDIIGEWSEGASNVGILDNANTWQHVSTTSDGTTYKIYVNGVQKYSTGASFNFTSSNFSLAQKRSAQQYYNGDIDDVRLYNRALATSEIEYLASGNPSTGSGVYTLGSSVNISGDLSIYGGKVNTSSYDITLSGSFINAGDFSSNGTVILDGGTGTTQALSGNTVFNNLSKQTTSANTLILEHTAKQSVSGALTLQGAASNVISLRSSKTGSAANLLLDATSGSQSLSELAVKDIDASSGKLLTCIGCTNSSNNTNWNFGGNVTGKVNSTSSNGILAGKTVSISTNGGAVVASAITDAGGQFTTGNFSLTGGTVITIYLDGETEKAVTVTVSTGSSMTGVDLYQNKLITRSISRDWTLADLSLANNNGDSDIAAIYTTGNSQLTISSGKQINIQSGSTLDLGDSITSSGSIVVNGTLRVGSGTWTHTGNIGNTGTIRTESSAINATGTITNTKRSNFIYALSGGIIGIKNVAYGNLIIGSTNDAEFRITSKLDVNGDITLSGGTLKDMGHGMTLSGSWIHRSSATFNYGNVTAPSTVELDGFNQTLSGTTTFRDLKKAQNTGPTVFITPDSTITVTHMINFGGHYAKRIRLRSTEDGNAAKLISPSITSKAFMVLVDVKDIDATGGKAIPCYINCKNTGNNTNWNFGTPVNITGTVYYEDGITPAPAGIPVAWRHNAGSFIVEVDETDANGSYALSGATMSGGTLVSINILSSNANRATTTLLASGNDVSGVDLYKNHIIVRSESGSIPMKTRHMRMMYKSDDAGLNDVFQVTNNHIKVPPTMKMLIWGGDTFEAEGATTAGHLDIRGEYKTKGYDLSSSGMTLKQGSIFYGSGSAMKIAGDFNLENGGEFHHGTGSLKISGDFRIANGSTFRKSANGAPLTLNGDLTLENEAGVNLGVVQIGESPDTITLSGNLLTDGLTINAGDVLVTDGFNVSSSGGITIYGTLDASNGVGGASTITLSGAWTNSDGAFTPGSSTVILDGTQEQRVFGSNTFYNLEADSNIGQSLLFEAGKTTSITNETTLRGTSDTHLPLTSSVVGTRWNINPNIDSDRWAPKNDIEYVSVRDGENLNGAVLFPENSTDAGNNINWFSQHTRNTISNSRGLGNSQAGRSRDASLEVKVALAEHELGRVEFIVDKSKTLQGVTEDNEALYTIGDDTKDVTSDRGTRFTKRRFVIGDSFTTRSSREIRIAERIAGIDTGPIRKVIAPGFANIRRVIPYVMREEIPTHGAAPDWLEDLKTPFALKSALDINITQKNIIALAKRLLPEISMPLGPNSLIAQGSLAISGTINEAALKEIGRKLIVAVMPIMSEFESNIIKTAQLRQNNIPSLRFGPVAVSSKASESLIAGLIISPMMQAAEKVINHAIAADLSDIAAITALLRASENIAESLSIVLQTAIIEPQTVDRFIVRTAFRTFDNISRLAINIFTEEDEEVIAPLRELAENDMRFYSTSLKRMSDRMFIEKLRIAIWGPKGTKYAYIPVTLHSDPQTVMTDENGIAEFMNVAAGPHELELTIEDKYTIKKALIVDTPQGMILDENDSVDVIIPLVNVRIEDIHSSAPSITQIEDDGSIRRIRPLLFYTLLTAIVIQAIGIFVLIRKKKGGFFGKIIKLRR